jgi:phage shock protein A
MDRLIDQIAERLAVKVRAAIKEGFDTMVDATADLTAEVSDALTTLNALVVQLEADVAALANIPPDNTAALEAQIARLTQGVVAAKAALAPVVPASPAPTVVA